MEIPKWHCVPTCPGRAAICFLNLVTAALLFTISSTTARAGGVVSNPTEADLRTALVGGGNVSFECDGTIFLANTLVITNTTSITATGWNITLSGSNTVRVLAVNPGVNLSLSFLKVQNGKASKGAGLLNDGGSVTVNNCEFSFNQALGTNGAPVATTNVTLYSEDARGGAVFSSGPFVASNSSFVSNSATGGSGIDGYYCRYSSGNPGVCYPGRVGGGGAFGGAIYSSSSVTLLACTLSNNSTRGGNGADTNDLSGPQYFSGDAGSALGGAIYSSNVTALISCVLKNNSAVGGVGGGGWVGGYGGQASGGALYHFSGVLTVTNSEFTLNSVASGLNGGYRRSGFRGSAAGGGIVGNGTSTFHNVIVAWNLVAGSYADGGGVSLSGSSIISGSRFKANRAAGDMVTVYGYPNLLAGPGRGGAVYNTGTLTIGTSLLDENYCSGATNTAPSNGGTAEGGGIFNSGSLDVQACTFSSNRAVGGDSRPGNVVGAYQLGGWSFGGGLCNRGSSCALLNSTFTGNVAQGGKGFEFANGGSALGGGIYNYSNAHVVVYCTIAGNQCVGGPGGGAGQPGQALGGGINQASENSIPVTNSIVSGNLPGDVNGLINGGPNLIGVDARLAPLADNGGPTPTMRLLITSPAINAAVVLPGVLTDQRGRLRTAGGAPDIGAFELNGALFYPYFQLLDFGSSAGIYHVRVVGPPSQTYRLQTSPDFLNWSDVSTNTTDSEGLRPLENLPPQSGPAAYYRTIAP